MPTPITAELETEAATPLAAVQAIQTKAETELATFDITSIHLTHIETAETEGWHAKAFLARRWTPNDVEVTRTYLQDTLTVLTALYNRAVGIPTEHRDTIHELITQTNQYLTQ